MTEQAGTELVAPKAGKLAATREFLVEARAEMDKVSWPPKPELIKATRAVIIGSLMLGVAIGVLDWLLQKLLVDGVALLAR
ncbi:MAG: preprotein translocase subunit SecE [Gemmatimonadota bacterium]